MTTYDTFSFGCRVNQAEMEALSSELEKRGATRLSEQPDIFVINTCSVTHKAEREARQMINQVRARTPNTHIVVTGCAATNWIKTKTVVQEAALLIDNSQKSYLADIIYQRIVKKAQTRPAPTALQPHNTLTRSGRIMLKIQDGCQRFCSFCIVPYLRGLPVSIPIETLTNQVNEYADYGLQEIIYAAINTEAYGYGQDFSFIHLLEHTLSHTHINRLSFGSIHPWSINDDFFAFYKTHANSPRLVDFFHIPLQSGSNKVLNLMKRGYTREEFLHKLATIQSINPLAFLATDVIVGYLDENDEDFNDTYDFLKKSPVSKFHVFRFSPRQHTAAFYLKKRLPMPISQKAQERSKLLRDLSAQKYTDFQQKHIGKAGTALVLEKREGEWQHALFENQMPLMVHTEKDLKAQIVSVQINQLKKGRLCARLV